LNEHLVNSIVGYVLEEVSFVCGENNNTLMANHQPDKQFTDKLYLMKV